MPEQPAVSDCSLGHIVGIHVDDYLQPWYISTPLSTPGPARFRQRIAFIHSESAVCMVIWLHRHFIVWWQFLVYRLCFVLSQRNELYDTLTCTKVKSPSASAFSLIIVFGFRLKS